MGVLKHTQRCTNMCGTCNTNAYTYNWCRTMVEGLRNYHENTCCSRACFTQPVSDKVVALLIIYPLRIESIIDLFIRMCHFDKCKVFGLWNAKRTTKRDQQFNVQISIGNHYIEYFTINLTFSAIRIYTKHFSLHWKITKIHNECTFIRLITTKSNDALLLLMLFKCTNWKFTQNFT